MKKPLLTFLCVGAGLLSTVTVSAAVDGKPAPPADVGLMQLREDFHLAGSLGDHDLMRSLWTEDAVFNGGGVTVQGADNIADFFASNTDLWGKSVTLTSESKTQFDVFGNTAMYAFECIIVKVDGSDPLSTSLSSLPPGSQAPNVEIVQHSNTSGIAVREDGRWKFVVFNGAGGPL